MTTAATPHQDFEAACEAVREARPQAMMNVGFAMELRKRARLGWGEATQSAAAAAKADPVANATAVADAVPLASVPEPKLAPSSPRVLLRTFTGVAGDGMTNYAFAGQVGWRSTIPPRH